MATVKTRTHKDGSISYEIRCSLGRDINDKQIFKYHTWTPEPDMTERQIEKALEREKVLFEERCRNGQVLDTQTKFSAMSALWLESKKGEHSPAYQVLARDRLSRINLALGHLPIGKIQPHHLRTLYKNLAETGIKKTCVTAVARDLSGIMKERSISRSALSKMTGLALNTVTSARQGNNISKESADKIAQALDIKVDALFVVDDKKEALSSVTVNQHHRIISAVMEFAVRENVIFDNPARRVEPPKMQKKEASFLNDKQALEVVTALYAAPLKWRTVTMLLIYSGMRRGEICGLVWTDIDFNNCLVHITKSNQYLPERGIFEKETKNKSSVRVVKLPPEMLALLSEYRKWQFQERLNVGDQWQNTGKVFTQWNGLPMHPDSITAWVAKFRESNNLPYFTPKSLRHTSATLLIMQGVPVKAVSARLGHANQNTTNMVYSHAIQTVDAMASEVIGDILKPVKNGVKKQVV